MQTESQKDAQARITEWKSAIHAKAPLPSIYDFVISSIYTISRPIASANIFSTLPSSREEMAEIWSNII